METRLEEIVREIKKSGLFKQGDRVTAGVSGGADSMLLLYALERLCRERIITLHVVHVHHGIRGEEADRDAEFVREQCRELHLSCRVVYEDVPGLAGREKLSLEEAGRQARYRCLYREMEREGDNKLAVAHHRDDCAETVLFNLVRGSGIKGMCGIAPVKGSLVRPLLPFRKSEIEAALQEAGIPWRTDSTNRDVRYMRNRIRHELIPYLEQEINPQAVEHITSAAEILEQIDGYMEKETDRWLSRYACPGSLPVGRLRETDPALQSYLIRRRLDECCGLKNIGRSHVKAVQRLLNKNGGGTVCLPGGRRVVREYDSLIFFDEPQSGCGMLPFSVSWEEISREKFEKILPDPYTKCFDYDKINQTLCLRTRKKGDRLAVYADGREQSVKKYMISAGIPASIRDRIPLLMCGDEAVWVVGYRASEKFRVTGSTERILLASAKKSED